MKRPVKSDKAHIFFIMFTVFFLVLTVLVGKSFGQDLVLLDSIIVPVMETYDTTCNCYPDSMIIYSWLDSGGEADDTLVAQFGYTRFGKKAWTTTVLIVDDADSGWSINPFIMHHLDPYDINRDGRVSLWDAALLIHRLFKE